MGALDVLFDSLLFTAEYCYVSLSTQEVNLRIQNFLKPYVVAVNGKHMQSNLPF
jgi:enoyl-CoA hydratase/carnithine racemase